MIGHPLTPEETFTVTAPEKLMQKLVHMATGETLTDPDAIRAKYDELQDTIRDFEDELRSGTHNTGLPCDYSRNYESRAVAAQVLDGSWVGWTYWYGGGKHGDPGSIPWIEDAYDLQVHEVPTVVKQFSKGETRK